MIFRFLDGSRLWRIHSKRKKLRKEVWLLPVCKQYVDKFYRDTQPRRRFITSVLMGNPITHGMCTPIRTIIFSLRTKTRCLYCPSFQCFRGRAVCARVNDITTGRNRESIESEYSNERGAFRAQSNAKISCKDWYRSGNSQYT